MILKKYSWAKGMVIAIEYVLLLLESSSVGLDFCVWLQQLHNNVQASCFCKYETADFKMVSFLSNHWESKLNVS